MAKTKIEWCDWKWNPVWGCLRGCDHCYARKIARRFAGEIHRQNKEIPENTIRDFVPTLIWSRLNAKIPNVRRVFVNSMSDIQFWKTRWWDMVVERIENRPLTDFLFLTKNGTIYEEDWFPAHRNIIRGVTDTCEKKKRLRNFFVDFVSAEPLHGMVDLSVYPRMRWLIVGAETGNRKEKIEPQREWLEMMLEEAERRKIPVFMKESMRRYCEKWGVPFVQEFYR